MSASSGLYSCLTGLKHQTTNNSQQIASPTEPVPRSSRWSRVFIAAGGCLTAAPPHWKRAGSFPLIPMPGIRLAGGCLTARTANEYWGWGSEARDRGGGSSWGGIGTESTRPPKRLRIGLRGLFLGFGGVRRPRYPIFLVGATLAHLRVLVRVRFRPC